MLIFTVLQMVALYKDPQGENIFKNMIIKEVQPNIAHRDDVKGKCRSATKVDGDNELISSGRGQPNCRSS